MAVTFGDQCSSGNSTFIFYASHLCGKPVTTVNTWFGTFVSNRQNCVTWSHLRQTVKTVSNLVTFVSNRHNCVTWSHLCQTVTTVSLGHICVKPSQLCHMVTFVSNRQNCVTWSHLCQTVTTVSHGHICVKPSQLCHMVTFVLNHYNCVTWSHLCHMVIFVSNRLNCVTWSHLCHCQNYFTLLNCTRVTRSQLCHEKVSHCQKNDANTLSLCANHVITVTQK